MHLHLAFDSTSLFFFFIYFSLSFFSLGTGDVDLGDLAAGDLDLLGDPSWTAGFFFKNLFPSFPNLKLSESAEAGLPRGVWGRGVVRLSLVSVSRVKTFLISAERDANLLLISAERCANLLLSAAALFSADDALLLPTLCGRTWDLAASGLPWDDTVGTGLADETCGFFKNFEAAASSACFFFKNLFPDVTSGLFLICEDEVSISLDMEISPTSSKFTLFFCWDVFCVSDFK